MNNVIRIALSNCDALPVLFRPDLSGDIFEGRVGQRPNYDNNID
jgi:hypothetical protein